MSQAALLDDDHATPELATVMAVAYRWLLRQLDDSRLRTVEHRGAPIWDKWAHSDDERGSST